MCRTFFGGRGISQEGVLRSGARFNSNVLWHRLYEFGRHEMEVCDGERSGIWAAVPVYSV